jgi:hypothetical protein
MKKERILLAIGLLLLTAHYFIDPFFSMPDYLRGFLVGIGFGLEIIALIRMNRIRKNGGFCSNKQEPTI